MSHSLTPDCLSKHDQEILKNIFNPLEMTSAMMPNAIDPDNDANLIDIEEEQYDADAIKQSKELEVRAIKLSEEQQLTEALQLFEQALAITPQRASIYNNRAQALRLADRDDDAFTDLNRSLELCTTQLKTKCHALCQRGVLFRKRENVDAAREDFEAAAKLGSQFAKQQLVEINPYAALCNQMLRQAFEQLK